MIRPPGSSARPDLPLAVVIGAGGMGAAIARRLGDNHRLLVADRDPARLEALESALTAEGHDAATMPCDITDARSVAALAERAGAWRTLAHVAALSPSMADFQTILAVNLLGARHVERAFHATAGQASAAIFISSLAAHSPPPAPEMLALFDREDDSDLIADVEALVPDPAPVDAYRLSKVAMNRMCRRRASVWGRKGARILSLSPGLIATPMGALEFGGSTDKFALYAKTPLEREGTMVEIAATVAFLTSADASFISGTDLLVDGGIAAALAFPMET
jgi:NAD(P)-dependent dehydrogenase (short-subunit alcohol dehydrogenase family)